MKEIKLLENEGIPSKEMLSIAIANNSSFTKGLVNIRKGLKLLDKVESSNEVLSLEDTEFDLIYKAVDDMQWAPGALKMGKFFEEIQKTKDDQ